MGNVHLVSNPAIVEIGGVFRVLMYHGASMNSFINEILEIKASGGHLNPTKIVREMLKRRHLAPLHGSVDYIPCENGDLMVISDVPDIIATADQHRAEVGEYNNILMVASSCWQSMTPFEEKVGNIPNPCKVPVFNMKTRDIKIFDFSGEVMKGVLDEAKI
jgi:DNA polymerase II small subunit/DNA polymerase delta subunit B